ncbi:MAG: alkaline phosphatase family protein [Chloroflexi bacterium]|nr:alkaline phosphatase family protein [Chloroflexota bacterium]
MARLLVIGLDGATWDLAKPWVQTGQLPTLSHLMAEGIWGELESTIPYVTPVAWSSFATGKNPGKHGIYGFLNTENYQTKGITSHDLQATAFWHWLSENGQQVGLVNIPLTYPAMPLNGFVISSMFAPNIDSPNFTYPQNLIDEILKVSQDYVITIPGAYYMRQSKPNSAREKIFQMLAAREAVVKYLLRDKPWDFFAVNFFATDEVQHYFWRYLDPSHPLYKPAQARDYGDTILSVYQRLDQIVAELLTIAGNDTNLIIMSDHGLGPTSGRVICLNQWLRQHGYLEFQSGSGAGKIKGMVAKGLLWFTSNLAYTITERYPGLSQKVQGIVSPYQIDYQNSLAYADEACGSIRLNLEGREPFGTVKLEEYRHLVAKLKDELLEMADPETGEKIVNAVYLKDEIYNGPALSSAPDLIVQLDDLGCVFQSSIIGAGKAVARLSPSQLQKTGMSGNHRQNGILIGYGPDIKPGLETKGARIYDIAPTILHTFGLPIPKDMDGRVLKEIFKPDSTLAQREIEYQEVEERQKVRERIRGLKALGKL